MLRIANGILQGCPLFGSLSVPTVDPLVFQLSIDIESCGLGVVRACPDDVGISLCRLAGLEEVALIFDRYSKLCSAPPNLLLC